MVKKCNVCCLKTARFACVCCGQIYCRADTCLGHFIQHKIEWIGTNGGGGSGRKRSAPETPTKSPSPSTLERKRKEKQFSTNVIKEIRSFIKKNEDLQPSEIVHMLTLCQQTDAVAAYCRKTPINMNTFQIFKKPDLETTRIKMVSTPTFVIYALHRYYIKHYQIETLMVEFATENGTLSLYRGIGLSMFFTAMVNNHIAILDLLYPYFVHETIDFPTPLYQFAFECGSPFLFQKLLSRVSSDMQIWDQFIMLTVKYAGGMGTGRKARDSVHTTIFPERHTYLIDAFLSKAYKNYLKRGENPRFSETVLNYFQNTLVQFDIQFLHFERIFLDMRKRVELGDERGFVEFYFRQPNQIKSNDAHRIILFLLRTIQDAYRLKPIATVDRVTQLATIFTIFNARWITSEFSFDAPQQLNRFAAVINLPFYTKQFFAQFFTHEDFQLMLLGIEPFWERYHAFLDDLRLKTKRLEKIVRKYVFVEESDTELVTEEEGEEEPPPPQFPPPQFLAPPPQIEQKLFKTL